MQTACCDRVEVFTADWAESAWEHTEAAFEKVREGVSFEEEGGAYWSQKIWPQSMTHGWRVAMVWCAAERG